MVNRQDTSTKHLMLGMWEGWTSAGLSCSEVDWKAAGGFDGLLVDTSDSELTSWASLCTSLADSD